MRLTRKKAIELCIELWTWLAETGSKDKWRWPKWKKYFADYTEIKDARYCWFCLYNNRKQKKKQAFSFCYRCPYHQIFGFCGYAGKPYMQWHRIANSKRDCKKYAKLFLEQIKAIE